MALSHDDPARLNQIGSEVVNRLRGLAGVFEARSDQTPGVREIQFRLRPQADAVGLLFEHIARQVRGAFVREEAVRLQRGREDVRVYVRLPREERDAVMDVEWYLIQTPDGVTCRYTKWPT